MLAGTVADGYWVRHQKYTDQSTLDLVAAATEVLGLTPPQILEAFGRFFHEFTMKAGYDNLLRCQGSNLRLWLSNVNALHDHLESSMPGFIKPVFWCEDDASSSVPAILLHYFSQRGSLLVPLVLGIVKEVALVHFVIEIEMDTLAVQGEGDAKFSTFRITAKDSKESWKLTASTSSSMLPASPPASGAMAGASALSAASCPFAAAFCAEKTTAPTCTTPPPETTGTTVGLDANAVRTIFPYHVVVDEAFTVLQVGDSFSAFIGTTDAVLQNGRTNISEILTITKPPLCSFDWLILNKLRDQVFFLDPLAHPDKHMKGSMVTISEAPTYKAMFVLTPNVKNMQELTRMNLTLSDLPLLSFQRDSLFLGELIQSEVNTSLQLDQLSKQLDKETQLSQALLDEMLPRKIADQLRRGKTVEPEDFPQVTIFFSDVAGFTDLSSRLPPSRVISLLNDLYCVMDYVADRFGLYKVETIGDAYMVCSGLPEHNENHARDVANFAVAVREAVKCVTSPLDGSPIDLRIGVHSGSVMAGVWSET